jgi:lipopolysaccharide/colanic/teichoic acid biosynthesis glycosyltransferase
MISGKQIHSQEQFRLRIAQEWRRSERSGRPALVVLFDGLPPSSKRRDGFLKVVCSTFRETDVFGWFHTEVTFGVVLLELGDKTIAEARETILNKVRQRVLPRTDPFVQGICATVHVIPPYTNENPSDESAAKFAESLWKPVSDANWVRLAIERTMDICGSFFLLAALSPLLLLISACVRLTSRGPALFRQPRTGLGGRPFLFYKFRTMKVGGDAVLHKEYVKEFIAGRAGKNLDEGGQEVYKLTNDPRVTPIGKFLRRTSLDELPQLWNVLRGDMSLVGPRPCLPYEVEHYGLWHRRRVYQLKPGLTGLWQVRGRSRCSFDEMIRMDLQHGREDSLGLYFKVLLETPKAVIYGSGAH